MSNFSYTDHTGDGITTTFPFSFVGQGKGYIRESDVYAYVDGEESLFALSGDNQVTFESAPESGSKVRIRRIMPKSEPFANFSRGNAFTQDLLNKSFLQTLYSYHEFLDGFLPTYPFQLKGDLDIAGGITLNGNLEMQGNYIRSLLPAVNDSDAATLSDVVSRVQELRDVLYEYSSSELAFAALADNESIVPVGGVPAGEITYTVKSMKTLVLSPRTSGRLYQTKGYHLGNSRGAAKYSYDPDMPRSEHTGGNIIDPTAPFPSDWNNLTQQAAWFNSSNVGTGCFVLQNSGGTRIKSGWFGAKGNGSAIDSLPLQAMVDAYLKYYDAYPQHDNYSQGTLRYPNLGRVRFEIEQGKYMLDRTLDLRYRGFFTIHAYGAIFEAKLTAPVNAPMVDYRYSNECTTYGLVYETATSGGIHRFLHGAKAGGSDDFLAGGYPSAKSVHFVHCEFRNPFDTGLDMTNDTGTFVAGVDGCIIDTCFFAGGAVAIKYAGYNGNIINPYIASQSFGGIMLFSASELSTYGGTWYMNNACPAIVVAENASVNSAKFYGSFMETMTHLVQVLGTNDVRVSMLFDGCIVEGCTAAVADMANRYSQLTFDNTTFGVSNTNRSVIANNTKSTLMLTQNQWEEDANGAMLNTAGWLGKVLRNGFLAGNPVLAHDYAVVDVYVDAVSGSDQNEGYALSRPLKTLTEAFRRVYSDGLTNIRLVGGIYDVPVDTHINRGHVAMVGNGSSVLNCANPISVNHARLTLLNLSVSDEQSVKVYGGTLNIRGCDVGVSSTSGTFYIQSGYASARLTDFTGSAGVAFYVGDEDNGVQADLFGDASNTWSAGITKYQAYSNITWLVRSLL